MAAHCIASGAASDDRDPGGQSGACRVEAAQQPEVVFAQPQKDLLRQIFDLASLARDAAYSGDNEAGVAPHKSLPSSLFAAQELFQTARLRQSRSPHPRPLEPPAGDRDSTIREGHAVK